MGSSEQSSHESTLMHMRIVAMCSATEDSESAHSESSREEES